MLLRIQINEHEPEEACDENTLQEWAKSGKVQGHHLIWSPSEKTWVQARKWPSLQRVFASSLWDAWDSTDDWELDPDIETGIRTRKSSEDSSVEIPASKSVAPIHSKEESPKEPPLLPSSALTPLSQKTKKKKAPNTVSTPKKTRDQTNDTLRSLEEELRSSMKSQRSTTPNVPLQPTQSAESSSERMLAQSWNKDASLRNQPQFWMNEEPPKSSFSFFRVSMMVVLGILPLLGYREWFLAEATFEFPLEEELDAIQKGVSDALQLDDYKREEALVALEQQLKAEIRTDTQEVNLKHSFSDALLIEMTYVDLNIKNIVADVVAWKGRQLNVPRRTVVEVELNSNGELDRELALVSMIIAKYTEHYTLEMDSFVVVLSLDGVLIRREIAVSEARNLLLRPGALPKFLDAILE